MLEIEIIGDSTKETKQLRDLYAGYGDVAELANRKGYAIKTNNGWILISHPIADDFVRANDALNNNAKIIGRVKKIVIERKK